MTKDLVKKAYEAAEEDLKQKQVDEVKRIVFKTLSKIEAIDKEIEETKTELKELEERKKLLRMDIDDLKEGRLDRIAERQEKDKKARECSVVLIIRETIREQAPSPWYWPYQVVWPTPTTTPNVVWYNTICDGTANTYCLTTGSSSVGTTLTNSVAKYATTGTYDVHGHIINLR